METKVTQVEQVASNCEKSCEFLSSTFEIRKKELSNAKSSINAKKRCSDLDKDASEHEKQKQKVQGKLNDRSIRENLLFLGIEETQNEDCTEKVKMFCEDELQLQHDTVEGIVIDRALRMGKLKPGSIRPIVVKFILMLWKNGSHCIQFSRLKRQRATGASSFWTSYTSMGDCIVVLLEFSSKKFSL